MAHDQQPVSAFLAGAGGCRPAGDGDTDPETTEIVFHRGNGTEPKTLDFAYADETAGVNVLFDLYEGLTRTDASGQLHPAIAQSWTISDDGHDDNVIFPCREPAKESLCVR